MKVQCGGCGKVVHDWEGMQRHLEFDDPETCRFVMNYMNHLYRQVLRELDALYYEVGHRAWTELLYS